jgi:release factor glutamine methyltransferase
VIDEKKLKEISQLISRRLKGEPVAYITGRKEFYGYDFKVNSHTLIPRNDTETLVESVINEFKTLNQESVKVLDLGTGSGCILLSILKFLKNEKYDVFGVGVDVSQDAIEIAKINARNLNVNEVNFICSDWNYLNFENQQFDIIVSNPPYIAHQEISNLEISVRDFEPITALDGGSDGLDCYRNILNLIEKTNYKILAFEVGIHQAVTVQKMMSNFKQTKILKDLSGIERIVIFMK